jgi:hypothetical protein
MEHTFEYDGIQYTWRRGTIRDKQIYQIVVNKILRACGWDENPIPPEESRGLAVYAEALAHLTPVKVDWWRTAGDTPEALAEGYQQFMASDEELYDLLNTASIEVLPSKKTITQPPKKSSE